MNAFQKAFLPPMGGTPPRRKSICARDPNAGPGSCYFYWDSCPAKVKNCFVRHMREWARDHEETTAEWEKAVAAWKETAGV